jgi:hypothetical protein
MTRKDYQLIAEGFAFNIACRRHENEFERENAMYGFMGTMIAKFQIDNPRFNEDKFKAFIEKRIEEITAEGFDWLDATKVKNNA